jgi:hypothetical protein
MTTRTDMAAPAEFFRPDGSIDYARALRAGRELRARETRSALGALRRAARRLARRRRARPSAPAPGPGRMDAGMPPAAE